MRTIVHTATLSSLLLAGACASTPEVEVGYYLPRSELALRAIRTVGCDSDDHLYSTTAVTAVTAFSRSENPGDRKIIRLKDIDTPMSNTDWGASFYDDGRLKGINATTVSKGDEIIKSAIQVAELMLPGIVPRTTFPEACKLIRERMKDKPLTIVYSVTEPFSDKEDRSAPMELEPGSDDRKLVEIKQALTPLCVNIAAPVPEEPQAALAKNARRQGYADLQLRQPARAKVAVLQGISDCQFVEEVEGAIWAGTVTSLKYGKESGAAGMLGVVSAGLTAAEADSTATRAAELKAEADLILQQQRLIRCQADPEKCS